MIRQYSQHDLQDMIRIWNEVVEEGIAFPQEDCLDPESGSAFFSAFCPEAIAFSSAVRVFFPARPSHFSPFCFWKITSAFVV